MKLRRSRIYFNLAVLFTLIFSLGINSPGPVNANVTANDSTDQVTSSFQPTAPNDIPGAKGVPLMTGKPALDGVCSADEYAGTLMQTFVDGNGEMAMVYIGHNGSDLFVCMEAQPGTFDERFGSLYLDPQADGSSYTFAQSTDYALHVGITNVNRSSYRGSDVANGYISAPSLDPLWDGVSALGQTVETVEWRVGIGRFGFGDCGALFGLATYHHWFSGVGDDYGWPSNQWFDQPRTWQLLYLMDGLCNPPPGEGGTIAYVFRGNAPDAVSFYNLLVTNGYTVTLVPLTDVLTTNFANFDLVIVADDTGNLNNWGTSGLTNSQVNQIKAGNKPIIGLGEGGYAFFGKLSTFIGWPNGWHGPDQDTVNAATPPANVIFDTLSSPLLAYTNTVNTVAIYLGAGGLPPDGFPIGMENPDTEHANIIMQGCRLLWGYSGNPLGMADDGKSLFLNAVAYMRVFQCPPEEPVDPGPCLQVTKEAIPPDGSTVMPGDVIEYTIKYTFSDNPNCNLPSQGRLTDYVPQGTAFIPGSASDGISPMPDGLLAWLITAASGEQTKTFKVQVMDAACATGQIANRAILNIPGYTPMASPVVTHTVECGPITLPNGEPMFAEQEVNIYPYPLILGNPSQIEVTLFNNSAVSQAITVEFQTSPNRFGIGLTFNTFDTDTIVVPAHGNAIAKGIFIPAASGHFCIQIRITGPNLPQPLITQRNLDVTEDLQAGVPDILTFAVGNPTGSTTDVILVVDNTCPGWTAVVNPAVFPAMAPGAVMTATLTVTPPNPVTLGSGCHIDVQGWANGMLIGGIRKLDVPPVHLPTDVVPPWEEREISFIPEIPVIGSTNQLCIELQNPLPITKTVTVTFSEADFGAGIGFTPVATQNFDLPPNSNQKYCVSWTPAASGTLHRCILVTLHQPGYLDMRSQRNVDLRRVTVADLIGKEIPFVVGNPDMVPHHLKLVPMIYGLDPSFVVQFHTDAGDPPPDMLMPGEVVNLNAILIGLNQNSLQPAAINSKFGDVAKIQVAVMLDDFEVGGFTIQLDNLQLFLPLIGRSQ